jgi:hypothetical protein
MANGALVTLQTRCTIPDAKGVPCGHIVKHFPMGAVPVIGESAGKQVQDFILALMNHLRKSHAQQFAEISNLGGTFMGFLSLRLFETMDPALHASVAQFGGYLRSMVAPPPVTDAMIQESTRQVLQSALANRHTDQEIIALLKDLVLPVAAMIERLRDYFTGILSPKKPEDTGVPAQ